MLGVGVVAGPEDMIRTVSRAHQFLTFTVPPNLQAAVAFGLRKPDSYFSGLTMEMQEKRDRLATGLSAAGFGVVP
jgi:aspartate/methionine/tyrosine aminotransferase